MTVAEEARPRPDTGSAKVPWARVGDLAELGHRMLPLGALCRLSAWRGRLLYGLRRREAEALRKNLAPLARGNDDAATLARRFLEEQQIRRLLIILAPRLGTEELLRLLPLRGLENLERALAGGSGAILLLSHLHSLGGLLAVVLLRRLGHDVRVAVPTLEDPWSTTRARRLLSRILGPEETLAQQIGGFPCQFNIRPIVRALKGGTAVAQTGDGWHSASFVDVQFLGRTLPFPTGMLSIARLTGVPVVPLFVTGPATRMEVLIEEPFQVARSEAALEEAVGRYAARLEELIRAWPAAWEHWATPDTLDTLASWRERPLRERYEV